MLARQDVRRRPQINDGDAAKTYCRQHVRATETTVIITLVLIW
jgi:hypothetical protein